MASMWSSKFKGKEGQHTIFTRSKYGYETPNKFHPLYERYQRLKKAVKSNDTRAFYQEFSNHDNRFDLAQNTQDLKKIINFTNDKGITLLMRASSNGNAEIVKQLKKCGAQISCQDNDGNTALIHCLKRGASDNTHNCALNLVDIAEGQLEGFSYNTNAINRESKTAMDIANSWKGSDWKGIIIELLKEGGAKTVAEIKAQNRLAVQRANPAQHGMQL